MQNADEISAAEFKTLIDNCMSDIIKTGFDEAATDAIISATLMSNSNLTEMRNLGIQLSFSVGSMWANSDNVNYLNNVFNWRLQFII